MKKEIKFHINYTLNLLLICLLYEGTQNLKLFQSSSEITIKLKGTGNQYILNNNNNLTIEKEFYVFNEIPDKILINGVLQDYTGNEVYNLEKEENNITMIFNNLLNDCNLMFFNLTNIIEIDLSKFDSSKVTGMAGMFYDCTSLSSIHFNNFNTASTKTMHRMFHDCNKLTFLDLSSFDTSSVTNMYGLFFSCYSLLFLDLNNFNTSSVQSMAVMFFNCTSLKILNLSNFDTSSVINFHGIFKFCSSLLSLNINNFNTSSANNMNSMFYGCNSLISLNIYNFETIFTKYIYDMFTDFNKNAILCLNEENAFIVDNIRLFNENYTNDCLNNCFSGENMLLIKEKNICISNCFKDDTYIYECENICYEKCPSYTHISLDQHSCEKDKIPILDWDVNKFFNGSLNISILNPNLKDTIKDKIRTDIINDILDLTDIIGGEKNDLVIKQDNTLYQITTSDKQNNKEYNDLSTIQLGQCEQILKQVYNIDENKPLIIFKIENFVPGVMIPIIGYDIFHPDNKTKLNLEYCKDKIVNFQIPVNLNENNLFMYDPNSEYYTDQCYSYTTDNGTDIILSDRHNEYNNNNYSLCEINCTFVEYNQDSKKASCDCSIKNKEYIISEIINDENILSSYEFKNENSFSNIVTMKCVYSLFTKEGLSTNSGNYILIIIIIIFSLLCILFYKFGFQGIINKIDLIIKNEEKKINKFDNVNNVHVYHKKRKSNKIIKSNPKKKSKKISNKNLNHKNSQSYSSIELNKKKIKNIETKKYKDIKKKVNKKNIIFTDYEINTFSYEKAKKYDKRTFCQYYYSLIKTKHPIIFSFIPINDYNSILIKISLFFILFTIIYIVNALFFDEATIHQIYEDNGFYNLSFFLPKIFFSFFISNIIYIFIKFISLSERHLLDIKIFFKDGIKITKIKRKITIKYTLFFIIGLGFLTFFWYYLSSFCAVYKNSQIFLIDNTLFSLAISFIYPIFINILPCIFRIISLRFGNKKIFYSISQILQFI